MNNQDSFDRIVSYFHALANKQFEYKGEIFVPYSTIVVNQNVFRSYTCPSDCGACCMKCSLIWDTNNITGSSLLQTTINGQTVNFWTDTQSDNKRDDGKCTYLKKDARCGIYLDRPLPCRLELFKFIHYKSKNKVYARVQLPGRNWSLTRVDGNKGGLCVITEYDKDMTQSHIDDLLILKSWMSKFKISNDVDKIVKFLKRGPLGTDLEIHRFSDHQIIGKNIMENKKMKSVKEIKTFNDTSDIKGLGSGNTDYDFPEPNASIFETFKSTTDRPYKIILDIPEWSGLCVAGDTLIDVACDEKKYPKGREIKDLVGTEGIVFSFDKDKNKPVARNYRDVRCTRKNTETIIVTYKKIRRKDNGTFATLNESITVTKDHLILVQKKIGSFEWIEAQNLKEGMQLIVQQRYDDYIRGYQRHRLIMSYLSGRDLTSDEHIHHIDGNHYNNTPDNLEIKTAGQHLRDHRLSEYGCDQSTIYNRIEHLVDKRTQAESLKCRPKNTAVKQLMHEAKKYYEQGYTIHELSEYYDVHPTTIMTWIKKLGCVRRTTVQTKELRKERNLSSLNHRVVSIKSGPVQDVYNMEVEDTECFFANGIIVHNCPVTKQPDFAHLTIEYIPRNRCIESKSLKLYVFAYRNYGCFMESTTNKFVDDIVKACDPYWVKVTGRFNARGGIGLDVVADYTRPDCPFDLPK